MSRRFVLITRDKRLQWRIALNPGNGQWDYARKTWVTAWNAKRAARRRYGQDIEIRVEKPGGTIQEYQP